MARNLGPLLWAAAVLAGGCGAPQAPSATDDGGASSLVRQRDVLRAEVELSGQDRPYLVLDLAESRLTLDMRGNALRDYPVLDVSRRDVRLAFVDVDSVPGIEGTSWTGGRLVPRRRLVTSEIVPSEPTAAPDDPSASALPPLPEELVAAPSRYAIRFDGSFALEIRAGAGSRRAADWRDRFEVLTGRAAPGLSIALSPEDAGSLYRSLDDGVALVIR